MLQEAYHERNIMIKADSFVFLTTNHFFLIYSLNFFIRRHIFKDEVFIKYIKQEHSESEDLRQGSTYPENFIKICP